MPAKKKSAKKKSAKKELKVTVKDHKTGKMDPHATGTMRANNFLFGVEHTPGSPRVTRHRKEAARIKAARKAKAKKK